MVFGAELFFNVGQSQREASHQGILPLWCIGCLQSSRSSPRLGSPTYGRLAAGSNPESVS